MISGYKKRSSCCFKTKKNHLLCKILSKAKNVKSLFLRIICLNPFYAGFFLVFLKFSDLFQRGKKLLACINIILVLQFILLFFKKEIQQTLNKKTHTLYYIFKFSGNTEQKKVLFLLKANIYFSFR